MPKPGYKTSELYVVLVTAILAAVQVLPVPAHAGGIVAAALAGLYALSRGLAKLGAPLPEPVGDELLQLLETFDGEIERSGNADQPENRGPALAPQPPAPPVPMPPA